MLYTRPALFRLRAIWLLVGILVGIAIGFGVALYMAMYVWSVDLIVPGLSLVTL